MLIIGGEMVTTALYITLGLGVVNIVLTSFNIGLNRHDHQKEKSQELKRADLIEKQKRIFGIIRLARSMRNMLATFEGYAHLKMPENEIKKRFNAEFLVENTKLDQMVIELDMLMNYSDADKALNNALRKLLIPAAILVDKQNVSEESFKQARDQLHQWSIEASEQMKHYYQNELTAIYGK